jgi:hypothetical protein
MGELQNGTKTKAIRMDGLEGLRLRGPLYGFGAKYPLRASTV